MYTPGGTFVRPEYSNVYEILFPHAYAHAPLSLLSLCFALWTVATECPMRKQAAAILGSNPHLFLYAGQDVPADKAWSCAQAARGVADSFAASLTTGNGRSPDERVPVWNTITKRVIFGKGEKYRG